MHILKISIAALVSLCIPAYGQDAVPYPDIANVSHADPGAAQFMRSFFADKTQKNVDATMSFFSPGLLTYTDATLGWDEKSFDEVKNVFAQYMPKWGGGKSYPLRVLGGPNSWIVSFVDTPELFGSELHILGVIDRKQDKIVRWIDYWDSSSYPLAAFEKLKQPQQKFPTTFREEDVGQNATGAIIGVSTKFQKVLSSGKASDLEQLLDDDAVYEDMATRSQILGRLAIVRFMQRAIDSAPYGRGSELRHIVGGEMGGGFEWKGVGQSQNVVGVTALELNDRTKITRITTVYDSRQYGPERTKELSNLSLER